MKETVIRLIFHALLAFFLANAANKFFVVNLDYEIEHGFYDKIYEGEGQAPDQYRILPLLPLKVLRQAFPFNTAVLIYNFIFSFFLFEMLWTLLHHRKRREKFIFMTLLAGTYIYCQYTGWRPDTIGLMLVSTFCVWVTQKVENPAAKNGLLLLGITALGFSRADIALIFALYFAIYHLQSWPLRILIVAIPLAAQAALQFVIYPDAEYYTKPFMLLDNLRMYYLLRNPATYLIVAVLIGFWPSISTYLRKTFRKYFYFYVLLVMYLLLVLFIGRINEYRLYLPFVPIFLMLWNDLAIKNEEKAGAV